MIKMLILVFILALIGVGLLWLANRLQRKTGLPPGRIIYTDTSSWRAVEKAFYDLSEEKGYMVEYRKEYKTSVIMKS